MGSRRDATWTDALASYLAERDPLLALDNCEHASTPPPRLAITLLATCPNVRIMATSREIFDMPGERVWRLEPLHAHEARRCSCNEHASAGRKFRPDARADETITRVCERLDRLAQLSETFARVASRFSDVSDYRYDVLVADVRGDMAYAIDYERFSGSIDGGPIKAVIVRSTHVHRREDGEWKSFTAVATTRREARARRRRRWLSSSDVPSWPLQRLARQSAASRAVRPAAASQENAAGYRSRAHAE